jgi:hypothetical protein
VVRTFCFLNFLVGLDNMMLRVREISILVGINVLTGRLGNRYSCTHQRSSQCAAQHEVFRSLAGNGDTNGLVRDGMVSALGLENTVFSSARGD